MESFEARTGHSKPRQNYVPSRRLGFCTELGASLLCVIASFLICFVVIFSLARGTSTGTTSGPSWVLLSSWETTKVGGKMHPRSETMRMNLIEVFGVRMEPREEPIIALIAGVLVHLDLLAQVCCRCLRIETQSPTRSRRSGSRDELILSLKTSMS